MHDLLWIDHGSLMIGTARHCRGTAVVAITTQYDRRMGEAYWLCYGHVIGHKGEFLHTINVGGEGWYHRFESLGTAKKEIFECVQADNLVSARQITEDIECGFWNYKGDT